MSFKVKKRSSDPQGMSREQIVRLVGVILIVTLLILGGLNVGGRANTAADAKLTGTPGIGTPTAVSFPFPPEGGTPLIPDRTFYHQTGLFSVPHFLGFDLAPDGQETVDPLVGGGSVKISRVGATFINGAAFAVMHTFIEMNPDQPVKTLDDLAKYYDRANLDSAWSNFTGGNKETGRKTVDGRYVINFELILNGQTYLGRQSAQVQNGWIKTSRLVVPNNNPVLLDKLEAAIWAKYTFNEDLLKSPFGWNAIVDPVGGYLMRYPATINRANGEPGGVYVAAGTANGATLILTTKIEGGRQAKTEDEARAWLKGARPNATVYTVQPEQRGNATGFTLAYNDPDPDGNSRSSVVTLLNAPNGLVSVNFQLAVRNLDLLKGAAIPTEITGARETLQLLDPARLIATLTPTVAYTPYPTPTPAAIPGAAVTATPVN